MGIGEGNRRGWGRSAMLLMLASGLVFAQMGSASAQVRGTIAGPGHATFPIAIVPPQGSGLEELGREFAETLGRNLTLSGLFRVLASPAPDRQPRDSGVQRQQIDFGAWEGLGARLLVKGAIGTQDRPRCSRRRSRTPCESESRGKST